MTPIDALFELFGRLGACQGVAVMVDTEELHEWPSPVVNALKSQRLIVKTRPAPNAICPGCESNCVMPVHSPPETAGASAPFIVCDKRSDINRVSVSSERIIQWQCSSDLVSDFVATCLGVRGPTRQTDRAGRWEIGIVFGDKRSQMLCLETNDTLALVAGDNLVPLAEFIEFRDNHYVLDNATVRWLVDAATTADNRYTPSKARREARKLETQAMYEGWRKAYRELRKKRPDMSDVWYSKQIAKKDIACGRDAETIRKRMKK